MKKSVQNQANINLHTYIVDYFDDTNLIKTKSILALNDEDAQLKAQSDNEQNYQIMLTNMDECINHVSEKYKLCEDDIADTSLPQWIVTFYLPAREHIVDDEFADDNTKQSVKIYAKNKEDAEKYCQQYIRIQQQDNNDWKDAEVESIEPIEN